VHIESLLGPSSGRHCYAINRNISNNVAPVKSFFGRTSPAPLWRVVFVVLFADFGPDQYGSFVI
jgi:hypothetical protein